ncbi:MAG: transcription termination/antitermination protein NusG [Chlamydiia bacterium]|jgi:transcriptional antiterminator NusG
MHHWYVVQVISGLEKKVKKSIEEGRAQAGMETAVAQVVLPTENVSEVKKGQQRVVERKVWPGYVIIQMEINDESWQYIKSFDGVIGFLGGEKPVPLSDAEVHTILSELENKQGGLVHRHDIRAGDKVKIVDGVFETFTGTVVDSDANKGKLNVLVSIFGRETKVELEFWQVEKIYGEQDQ